MKILHVVTRSEIGGAQSVVANLALEQARLGHQVAVASGPEGAGEAWKDLPGEIERLDLDYLVRDISPRKEVAALGELARLYRSWRPQIVNLHTSKAGLLGRLAPGLDRKRIVYTMHGYFQLRDINRKFLVLDKALRSRCGAIVAVSRNDELLMAQDGYRPVCIPNGIPDLGGLEAPAGRVLDRIQELKAAGLHLIMIIARNASFKRLDLAREAAALLTGRANFVWIGGEAEAGDPGNFHALGGSPRAQAFLPYADIYLQPSDHEGLSMSLLEALAAGRPSVASSVGGNLECLGQDPAAHRDDGSEGPLESAYGVLVPNRARAMAQVLARLCDNPEGRRAMGQEARRVYEERYSSAAMAKAYVGLYQTLAPESSS